MSGIASIDGVAIASVASVDGVAKASIKYRDDAYIDAVVLEGDDLFTGMTNDTNATIGSPRRKVLQHPVNRNIWWALITDAHDQLWSTNNAGETWERMTDSAGDPYDSVYAAQIAANIDYHAGMSIDPDTAGQLWCAYPNGSPAEIYYHQIDDHANNSSDIGTQWNVSTDTGIDKRAVSIANDDYVWIITRTVNNTAGNIRYFQYDKANSLQSSGWVVNTGIAAVRVGVELWGSTPVVCAWYDNADNSNELRYFVWNGSGFTAPTYSSIMDTVTAGDDKTRYYSFTIQGDVMHVVWVHTNLESIKHAYMNLSTGTGWTTLDAVTGLTDDVGDLFPCVCGYRDKIYMFYQHFHDGVATGQDIYWKEFSVGNGWGDENRISTDGDDNSQPAVPSIVDDSTEYILGIYHNGSNEAKTFRLSFEAIPTPPSGTLFVDHGLATGADDGSSWENAYQDLQSAITARSSGEELWVKEHAGITSSAAQVITMKAGVDVYGGFASTLSGVEGSVAGRDLSTDLTIIDGESHGNRRGVTMAEGCILDGVKIVDCDTTSGSNYGAGVYANAIECTIQNVTIDNCDAHYYGGGIMMGSSATDAVTASNCTITNCTAERAGGGVYISGASFTGNVTDCKIDSCDATATATYGGGGIGIRNNASYVITGTVITNCDSRYRGGGIRCDSGSGSPQSIVNCSIADNTAQYLGGGIRRNQGTVTLVNTIVYGNTHDTGVTDEISGTVTGTYCNVRGGLTGTGNIDSDPSYVGSGDDPYNIDSASPCIDAGDGDEAPTLDILGNARVDDPSTSNTGTGTPAYTDIGAYEFQSA